MCKSKAEKMIEKIKFPEGKVTRIKNAIRDIEGQIECMVKMNSEAKCIYYKDFAALRCVYPEVKKIMERRGFFMETIRDTDYMSIPFIVHEIISW